MSETVSIIIATYRRDEALRNALNSLGKQSYAPIEIVLVDDNALAEWNEKVHDKVDPSKVYAGEVFENK